MAEDNTTTPPAPQGQTPNGTDPQGQTPTNPPSGQTPNGAKTSIDSLPADIQEYIKGLRADSKRYRDSAEAEAKAKKDAEDARLKEQGEFKALAEKHEARVKELEPVSERYGALSSLVSDQIETQIKDWPQEVKTFDPGKDAPIEHRLEWLEKSKPLIAKLADQQRATNPGNGPNPQPSAGTPDTARAAFEQKMRRTGKYGA